MHANITEEMKIDYKAKEYKKEKADSLDIEIAWMVVSLRKN